MSRQLQSIDKRRGGVTAMRDELRRLSSAQKGRFHDLVALIRRRTAEITDGFFEIGEALAEIQNNALYRAAGHTSMDAFLAAEGLIAPNTARKLIAVATLVPREHAVRLGSERSYLLTRIHQVSPEHPPLELLLRGKVDIDGVPANALSTRALQDALRKARHRALPLAKRNGREPPSEDLRDAVSKALRKRGVHGARVEHARREGRALVTITLAAASVRRLLDAL